jgi:hypothetical protein
MSISPGYAGTAGVRRLGEMLGWVPDPPKARGVRHRIGAVPAVTVFAVLAGARSFREAGDRAADLPRRLLALAGCRQHPLTGRYVAPSESTIRRIAHDIDADAADQQVCRWLREHAHVAASNPGSLQGHWGTSTSCVRFLRCVSGHLHHFPDSRWYGG